MLSVRENQKSMLPIPFSVRPREKNHNMESTKCTSAQKEDSMTRPAKLLDIIIVKHSI